MQIRWLGTAGFELKTGDGAAVLIDPYLSRHPAARPKLPVGLADIPRARAIFVTHGHFDHAFDVPALAARLNAPVYTSAPVCKTLVHHGTPLSYLHPLSPGDSAQVGNLEVHALAARHVRFDLPLILRTLPRLLTRLGSLHPLLTGWPPGQILGYHIIAPDLSLVHLGSAGWVEAALENLRPDVALLPLQGRSDIAQVAARMAALLQPQRVVPHHWDDFYPPISQLIPLAPFAEALSHALPAARLHVPEIGQWWRVL